MTIEDVADLLPLTRPLIVLVATGDDSVNPGEMCGAEVLEEPVRAGLQAGAGRLVLLSPGNIFHFSHGTMITQHRLCLMQSVSHFSYLILICFLSFAKY